MRVDLLLLLQPLLVALHHLAPHEPRLLLVLFALHLQLPQQPRLLLLPHAQLLLLPLLVLRLLAAVGVLLLDILRQPLALLLHQQPHHR